MFVILRILVVIGILGAIHLPGALLADTDVDGHFRLRLIVNGEDVTQSDTITLDPAEDLLVVLVVEEMSPGVTLERLSLAVMFLGQEIASPGWDLTNVAVGREKRFTRKAGEYLDVLGFKPVTGRYETKVRLDYRVDDAPTEWLRPLEVTIPGNPVATPVGVAAVATGAVGVLAALGVIRAVVSPTIALGSAAGGVSATPLDPLQDLALDRLEPMARGKVASAVTKAAHKRISRDRCPMCGTKIRHNHCDTCQKTAREVRQEFSEQIQELMNRAVPLLAQGGSVTLDALSRQLGITRQLATDVLAVARHARLVKVRGLARKLTGKVVMMGVSTGLSATLWVTVGGFARLTPTILIAIVVSTVVVPLLLTRLLAWRAGRALRAAAATE